jgi:hypothetical protein
MYVLLGSIPLAFIHPVFLITLFAGVYFLLEGGLDTVRTFGVVYWVRQNDHRLFSVGKATMHQLSAPWKKGKGLYVALFYKNLQIGLCFKQNLDETNGTLSAIQGRYLDVEPKEIGKW